MYKGSYMCVNASLNPYILLKHAYNKEKLYPENDHFRTHQWNSKMPQANKHRGQAQPEMQNNSLLMEG